jgi:deoxyribonuclease-1
MLRRFSVVPLILLLALPTIASPAPSSLPHTASTFIAAKKALYDLYADHRQTFYCNCQYDTRRHVDLASCGLSSLADTPRARRIEAEHIFPAALFGNFRPCWRSPKDFPQCVKSSGKTVSGRECCQRVDPLFDAAHNDLVNLVPAVGEVNGKRSDYSWGMVPGEKRQFGTCNIEVDGDIRRAEPPENVMGDIARIWGIHLAGVSHISWGKYAHSYSISCVKSG